MKVLYLVTDDWYFLSHRLDLARAARDAGARVVVATAPGTRVAEIEREGFEHRPVRFHRGVSSQLRNAGLLLELVRLYRAERPDLVHHVSFLPSLYGSLAARRAEVPAVVNAVTGLGHAFSAPGGRTLRWAVERGWRLALLAAARRASLALFQNREDLLHFVDRALVDPERALCVPGAGVDTRRFAARPEPVLDAGTAPVVLHASRMLWTKGVGDSVAAARLLRRRGVPHRLVLAGRTHPSNPGSIPEVRLRAWREEGVAEWIGEHSDMPALLAACHVFCLPSAYREGVPLALLEACATGRPVVTTDVPGCRDVVGEGGGGLLVEPYSPEQLADALETLLADPELRSGMGTAGRERVCARFAKEHVVGATLAGYRRLCGWPVGDTSPPEAARAPAHGAR